MTQYPLATPPFWTIQGEGHLVGQQMAFIRLAGCSVGCAECDTDYKAQLVLGAVQLAAAAVEVIPAGQRDRWVWITGGEPTDHHLRPLIRALKAEGVCVALATSGVRRVIDPVDWLSVSPHDNAAWVQRSGDECKIVPGLNGATLGGFDYDRSDFLYYYAQPLAGASVAECVAWVQGHPGWSLGEQMHKRWGVA